MDIVIRYMCWLEAVGISGIVEVRTSWSGGIEKEFLEILHLLVAIGDLYIFIF